jgi:hypothetical protein
MLPKVGRKKTVKRLYAVFVGIHGQTVAAESLMAA